MSKSSMNSNWDYAVVFVINGRSFSFEQWRYAEDILEEKINYATVKQNFIAEEYASEVEDYLEYAYPIFELIKHEK